MACDWTRRDLVAAAGAAVIVGASGPSASAKDAGKAPRKDGVKIVGVCCSPRKGKTTAASLKVCLAAAGEVDAKIETELIELAGMAIPGQLAAGVPLTAGEKDDFGALVPKLSDPKVGGIIIGTPVYFGNMTFLCKAFLDRCIVFRKNKFALGGKVGGVLAVGGCRNGGQELTIQSVQAALLSQQLVLVGDGVPTAHIGATVWSGGKSDVTEDTFGMSTAKNLGRHVAKVALRLSAAAD